MIKVFTQQRKVKSTLPHDQETFSSDFWVKIWHFADQQISHSKASFQYYNIPNLVLQVKDIIILEFVRKRQTRLFVLFLDCIQQLRSDFMEVIDYLNEM